MLLIASTNKISNPRAPKILKNVEFTLSPIITMSLDTTYIAIPMNGTKNIVMLCANTMSSRGSFPNVIAMIAPKIITQKKRSQVRESQVKFREQNPMRLRRSQALQERM